MLGTYRVAAQFVSSGVVVSSTELVSSSGLYTKQKFLSPFGTRSLTPQLITFHFLSCGELPFIGLLYQA
jgi:hypothetical protein